MSEFLIAITSLFASLYFIFWTSYLGCNYALAGFYLNDFSLCELDTSKRECWIHLKRKVDSLKFVKVNQLYTQNSTVEKTVHLVFDYSLPIIGLREGVKDIKLSSSLQPGKWQ
ncbi:MAG: hypothetical protein B7Y39_14495 [Bdellovibrio sp. 28-41-41]|nr:MAG: hypothetical protein B7Y39_14495 [Bdellovibrio sp. 28-41-41]